MNTFCQVSSSCRQHHSASNAGGPYQSRSQIRGGGNSRYKTGEGGRGGQDGHNIHSKTGKIVFQDRSAGAGGAVPSSLGDAVGARKDRVGRIPLVALRVHPPHPRHLRTHSQFVRQPTENSSNVLYFRSTFIRLGSYFRPIYFCIAQP